MSLKLNNTASVRSGCNERDRRRLFRAQAGTTGRHGALGEDHADHPRAGGEHPRELTLGLARCHHTRCERQRCLRLARAGGVLHPVSTFNDGRAAANFRPLQHVGLGRDHVVAHDGGGAGGIA